MLCDLIFFFSKFRKATIFMVMNVYLIARCLYVYMHDAQIHACIVFDMQSSYIYIYLVINDGCF